MNKMIMLHTGPWGAEQMRGIAAGFDKGAPNRIASLYSQCDDTGLFRIFADELKNERQNERHTPAPDDLEAIRRCRFLRKLPISRALSHWKAIGKAWIRVLDANPPYVVISELMDSYIIDSLQKECALRDIPFLGLVTSFVNGYFRATTYGEYRFCRKPSEAEVDYVTRSLIDKAYKPQFISLSEQQFRRQVIYRWAKNIGRVVGLGALTLIPKYRRINMLYGGFKTATEWLHLIPRVSLGQTDWRKKYAFPGKPVIYVPLQHVPEATIDYWCHNVAYIDYENVLYQLIENYSEQFNFLLKEHPNVLGLRNRQFYDRFEKHPAVAFAQTTASSNDLIEESDAILVWTGSAGFEAALRGKPVLMMTPVYYMSGDRFMVLSEATCASQVFDFIELVNARPVTRMEQLKMVNHLLSGLVEGSIAFVRNFEAVKTRYTSPQIVGEHLRLVFDRRPDSWSNGRDSRVN